MPILNNFPVAQQATINSCWACAAREIINWYQSRGQSGGQSYAADQQLADAWAVASHDDAHRDIHVQQSAAAALYDLGFANSIDERPVPLPEEIAVAISNNSPLLAIVGAEASDPSPNPDYQNGHWVVITGVVEAEEGHTLFVFDPDDGLVHQVPYDAVIFHAGAFWQNTSYVDQHAG